MTSHSLLWSRTTLIWAVFLAEAVLLQWAGGAYSSEFGESPDEAAHFVTALMVRDYAAAGFPWPPMRFAETYYEHYPKIALGHWPPVYYLIAAAWMLLWSPSRVSVLLLQAVIAASWAVLLFQVARRVAPEPLALAAGLSALALNQTVESIREVMSDGLVAALVLAALLLLLRFLETQEVGYAVGFGVATMAGLLTKGSAVLILTAAPIAATLSGNSRLFRRGRFWLPFAIAAGGAAPWYLFAPDSLYQRSLPGGAVGFVYSPHNYLRYLGNCVHGWFEAIGPFVAPFLVAGLILHAAVPLWRRRRLEPMWAVMASTLPAMVLMYEVVPPSREPRQMMLILPALLLFAVRGLRCVFDLRVLARVPGGLRVWLPALLLPCLLLAGQKRLPPKRESGFGLVAGYLMADPAGRSGVVLISSDSSGEGALVSEMAMRENRLGHRILRATKVLSSSDWTGGNQKLLYSSPQEVQALLRRAGVRAVVYDEAPYWTPIHHRLVKETLMTYRDEWRLAASFSRCRAGCNFPGSLRVYLHQGPPIGSSGTRTVRQLPLARR